MSSLTLLEAFADLPDTRRGAGQRHKQSLCLAMFTLAVCAGCRGFIAIGDWIESYRADLVALFQPKKERLPSYSTIRRVLLELDAASYGACLARFFQIEPQAGETLAWDGKSLRGSYNSDTAATNTETHRAITLVTVYLVERGLTLAPQQVERKSNEIKAFPAVIEQFAQKGVVFAFDALNTQKKL
jgi:hypothetical protein